METVHGSCVELGGHGLILRGAPGAGKSDLALRLIDRGARLVADDQVVLSLAGGMVVASAPRELRGLLEVRGLGIVRLPAIGPIAVHAVIDLAEGPLERMPVAERETLLGVDLPLYRLLPFEPSAAAKVALIARALGGDDMIVSDEQER